MTMIRYKQVFFSKAHISRTKKAPILRLGLFESGRRNRLLKIQRPPHNARYDV